MKVALAGAFLLFLTAMDAAAEVWLEGALTQGGLVVGETLPGSAVSLDGRRVRVSADGFFILGFGRDAKPEAQLEISSPDGSTAVRTLRVGRRKFPVQRIDGLPQRQVTPAPEDLRRIRADAAAITAVRARDSAVPYFASGFARPLMGRVSGVFGSQRILNGEPRSPHGGLDIAAPRGTVVVAAADGIVALADADMFYTGKTVMIDHGHGLASVYAHMQAILVEPGQWVGRGQPIGRVGSSGRATGPHLHWGVSLFSTRLDPALLAPAE